jgi:hypothetical protein
VAAAARAAGYARSTAKSDVYRYLRESSPFRLALAKALDKAEIRDAELFKVLKDGLAATERRSIQRTERIDVGTTKDGRPQAVAVNTYTAEALVAWEARLHYAEAALRLKGYLGHETPEEAEPERQRRVNVVLNLGCP